MSWEGGALIAGTVFFFGFALIAWIVFRMLRKTVKMAVRMMVVAVIMAVAVIGGISLYWFGTGTTATKSKPASSRSK